MNKCPCSVSQIIRRLYLYKTVCDCIQRSTMYFFSFHVEKSHSLHLSFEKGRFPSCVACACYVASANAPPCGTAEGQSVARKRFAAFSGRQPLTPLAGTKKPCSHVTLLLVGDMRCQIRPSGPPLAPSALEADDCW